VRALLISDRRVTEAFSTLLRRPGLHAGFQWWRSGDITRTQNVSEYISLYAWFYFCKSFIGFNQQSTIGLAIDLLSTETPMDSKRN